MKITKLVNNNIVTSEDMQGREIIVMGRGLGFGKKPGMEIDVGKIEKVFRLSSEGENQKLVDMIQDIPLDRTAEKPDCIYQSADVGDQTILSGRVFGGCAEPEHSEKYSGDYPSGG